MRQQTNKYRRPSSHKRFHWLETRCYHIRSSRWCNCKTSNKFRWQSDISNLNGKRLPWVCCIYPLVTCDCIATGHKPSTDERCWNVTVIILHLSIRRNRNDQFFGCSYFFVPPKARTLHNWPLNFWHDRYRWFYSNFFSVFFLFRSFRSVRSAQWSHTYVLACVRCRMSLSRQWQEFWRGPLPGPSERRKHLLKAHRNQSVEWPTETEKECSTKTSRMSHLRHAHRTHHHIAYRKKIRTQFRCAELQSVLINGQKCLLNSVADIWRGTCGDLYWRCGIRVLEPQTRIWPTVQRCIDQCSCSIVN